MKPTHIDAVFIIHAEHLLSRRISIESQLKKINFDYEFIIEHDAKTITSEIDEMYFSSKTLTFNQKSCALKHIYALKKIVARNINCALILEDDVILLENFIDILEKSKSEEMNLPKNHVTFLGCGGHYYINKNEIIIGKYIYKKNQGKFADSYLITQDAARHRLKWLEKNKINKPIDHFFEIIDRHQKTEMYWLEPPITEQGSHNGVFGSTLEKSHPLWFQKLQFKWKKLWRRTIKK